MAAKRYFFDDGKVRKFWSINQRGKKITTHYGTLGKKGREVIKDFASAAEAKDAAVKQTLSKTKKGYILIDASQLKINKMKGTRKATETQVAKLEKQIGAKLLQDYRDFLLTHNGGHPEGTGDINVIAHPTPYGYIACVSYLYTFTKKAPAYYSLNYAVEQSCPILPAGHLPITDSGSNLITIDLVKNRGCVYYFDHELPGVENYNELEEDEYGVVPYKMEHAVLLAGSFDEMLTRIAVFEEID